ncbi:hypothetical protein KIN20_003122 [Parelaphostrongylus tenuis]|uniref:Peptidase S9 prolyl oligopeptidase catalytic domain-containing protein n=1 Tax=Parelaphostrongylus tenuis TaxID=148309 RepID=A0AAD5QH77_PARTN|nr:hypothetical protein KIN20_003122 [Parelaphostrongylus tenuis]
MPCSDRASVLKKNGFQAASNAELLSSTCDLAQGLENRNFVGPSGKLPPVLLLGHGGPTAAAVNTLDLKKQFFTSRGFAVLDVNYRGSTGFGTDFRNMLKRQWGVVDRDDMIAAAHSVITRRLVDEDKVCILGSSAGGYLLLSVLIHSDIFKAAVSIYGVADLVGLAKDTHKFERGYNEVLIGKYPEEEDVYSDRSPINHIDRLETPIASYTVRKIPWCR